MYSTLYGRIVFLFCLYNFSKYTHSFEFNSGISDSKFIDSTWHVESSIFPFFSNQNIWTLGTYITLHRIVMWYDDDDDCAYAVLGLLRIFFYLTFQSSFSTLGGNDMSIIWHFNRHFLRQWNKLDSTRKMYDFMTYLQLWQWQYDTLIVDNWWCWNRNPDIGGGGV